MIHLHRATAIIGLLLSPVLVHAAPDDTNKETTVTWERVSEAPFSAFASDSVLIGLHDDVLVVAGHANGSSGNVAPTVWIGSRSEVAGEGADGSTSQDERPLSWHNTGQSLPGGQSYSLSVNHKLGLLAISDSTSESSRVVLVRWDRGTKQLQILRLPSLPAPARNGGAAVLGDTLHVVVASGAAYAFDLSQIETDLTGSPIARGDEATLSTSGASESPWRQLPSLPIENGAKLSSNRIVAVEQNDGRFDRLFVVAGQSGSALSEDASSSSTRVWMLDSRAKDSAAAWIPRADLRIQEQPVSVTDASGIAVGQTYFLLVGNSSQTGNRAVFSYNAVTNVWVQYEDLSGPGADASMSRAVNWNDKLVLIAGKPGSVSAVADVWAVSVTPPAAHIGWLNMTIVVLYLLAMVLIGVYFAKRNKDTNDYFRGGQHVPWWAAACSIYATLLSSLTYLALPALVYRTDWVLYGGIVTTPILMFFIAYVIMPAYRKLGITSVYEYLSARYNMVVRLFASTLFVLFQIGRMGIVLALTALALSAITPLNAWESVLIMGVLSLIYSTMGGVEAVIWTDTIQTIVLMIGVFICLGLLFANLDGGVSEFLRVGVTDNKFKIVNLDFGPGSIHTLAIWVIILGSFGQNTSNYTADQAVVQRYMTAKDTKSAVKTVWMNAAIMAPSLGLFYLLGTALYVFYQSHPAKLDPTLHTDQIFPMFIGSELPIGLAGIMVAGIFAAAQSTISTSMNSSASIIVTDFMRTTNFCKSEQGYLKAARWLTILTGILGTIAGTVFISPEIRSLLVEYFKVIGMFMGVLGGLFLLGLLTKRTNSWGAMIGIFSSVGVVMTVWRQDLAHGFIFATIGISSCVLIGYVASLLTPWANHDIEGLTVYTMRDEE